MQQAVSTLMIGDVRVRALIDLDGYALDIGFVFPDAKPEDVDPHRSWLEPTYLRGKELYLVVRSLVMEVDGRVILIDACVGEDKDRPTRPFWNHRQATGYIERLAMLGFKPEDIDVVFCTHLHTDHVGWNTQLKDGRWVPTFSKARYLFGRLELDHWMAQPNRAEVAGGAFVDSVIPILEAKQADLVDDGHDLGKGLVLKALFGHTPGQLGLDVRRGGERALFVGDAIHSPLQMAVPELSTCFCTDKAIARETRKAFLEQAAEYNSWLVPCHFRGPLGSRIKRNGKGYVFA
jgi:glyoxylase-like metal-dependent hydrolase (beta-lactamase superfamily II)